MADKTLVLDFGRCHWGKCVFCGYGRIHGKTSGLRERLAEFLETLGEGDTIKVFGSGSFFDEKQIPEQDREFFVKQCRQKGVGAVTVESRPEFINKKVLEEFEGIDLTVAIGLESSSDSLRKKLCKGFTRKDYEGAVKWAKKLIEVTPHFPAPWRYLVASLALLGRMGEARAAKDQLLHLQPHENLQLLRSFFA